MIYLVDPMLLNNDDDKCSHWGLDTNGNASNSVTIVFILLFLYHAGNRGKHFTHILPFNLHENKGVLLWSPFYDWKNETLVSSYI